MTTQSGPGQGPTDRGLSVIMSERRQLINLTYRLLGSLAEAEDARRTESRPDQMPPFHRGADGYFKVSRLSLKSHQARVKKQLARRDPRSRAGFCLATRQLPGALLRTLVAQVLQTAPRDAWFGQDDLQGLSPRTGLTPPQLEEKRRDGPRHSPAHRRARKTTVVGAGSNHAVPRVRPVLAHKRARLAG